MSLSGGTHKECHDLSHGVVEQIWPNTPEALATFQMHPDDLGQDLPLWNTQTCPRQFPFPPPPTPARPPHLPTCALLHCCLQTGRTGPDGLDQLAIEAEILECNPLPDG
jgi:hypothetical protein